jgi:hypothetical protein
VLGHPERRVEHRVVLDRGDEDAPARRVVRAPTPEQTLDREVVRLGATARHDDLARARAEGRRETLAALLDGAPRRPSGGVQRRRVAGPDQVLGEDGDRLGEHRRGRRVVQIDTHLHECTNRAGRMCA